MSDEKSAVVAGVNLLIDGNENLRCRVKQVHRAEKIIKSKPLSHNQKKIVRSSSTSDEEDSSDKNTSDTDTDEDDATTPPGSEKHGFVKQENAYYFRGVKLKHGKLEFYHLHNGLSFDADECRLQTLYAKMVARGEAVGILSTLAIELNHSSSSCSSSSEKKKVASRGAKQGKKGNQGQGKLWLADWTIWTDRGKNRICKRRGPQFDTKEEAELHAWWDIVTVVSSRVVQE